MMSLSELRELPEAGKLQKTLLLALSTWVLGIVFLVMVTGMDSEASRDIATADRIVNAAITFKAHPDSGAKKNSASADDPYAVASEIVATLDLEDRIQNLSTQTSGVLLQIERLYGEEMARLITLFASQGLDVRTAEIRALPVGKERLLSATFSLEAAK